MLLDEREIALLARFFAKRFPEASDRQPLLERAGLDDSPADGPAAWEEIVARAQEQKALGRLGKALRIEDGDDPNLREVRQLLADEARPSWSLPAATLGAVAGLAVVLVGAGAWALGAGALEGREQALARQDRPIAGAALAETVNTASSVEIAAASAAEVAVARPVVDEAAPVAAPVVPGPAPVAQAAVVAATTPDGGTRHVAPDHCARKGGDVGGWWYFGSAVPGKAGDVIVVPHDAYVRAEVPSTSNGWNTRTTVTCVLYAGDKVRLAAAPASVPVGAWWVSTSSADVVVAGGKRVRDRG